MENWLKGGIMIFVFIIIVMIFLNAPYHIGKVIKICFQALKEKIKKTE